MYTVPKESFLNRSNYVVYSYNTYHILTQWIKTSKDFFKEYISHFIVRFACERELETEQRLQYIDPTLMAISVSSFLFSWCSTGGPGAQLSAECWLSLPHLFTNGSPKLLGAPRAPSAGWWLSLPYLVSNSSDLQLSDFLSPPSYIIVQSHTQSLERHDWSSSSGNNCHAV